MSVELTVPAQQKGRDESGDAASLAQDGESDIRQKRIGTRTVTVPVRAFFQRRRSMEGVDIGSLKEGGKSRQRLIVVTDVDVCWMQERKRDAKLQIDMFTAR